MICDNCDGRRICKFKEDCMIFERNLISQNPSLNNRVFGAIMTCAEKTNTSTAFNMFTRPSNTTGVTSAPCGEYALGEGLTKATPRSEITLDTSNPFSANNTHTKEILAEISDKLKK